MKPGTNKPGAHPLPAIVCRKIGGYRVSMFDDGVDYWDLAAKALKGAIPKESRPERDGRQVHFFRHGGRRYVLKTDSRPVGHLDSKLRRLWYGPVYSTVMRRIREAAGRGCDLVQMIYMTAEKMERGLAIDSIMVAEYMEGPTLAEIADPGPHLEEISNLMTRLHGYGLAFVDPNQSNFILTKQGLRVIDLSFGNNFLIARARDYLEIKQVFNVDLPPAGLVNSLLAGSVRRSIAFRHWLRRVRSRK